MKLFFNRLIYSICGLAVALFATVSIPAFAEDGTQTSGSDTTSTSGGDSSSTSGSSETEMHTISNQRALELMRKAHQDLLLERQNEKERTQTQRENVCKARRHGVENRLNNFAAQAERHKTFLDNIYTKAKNYHDSKNLDVANYTELTAKVDAAQADAAAKIAVLKALDVNIDCTQANVADNVSAFRQALKDTLASMKTYRSALKDLLKAIHDTAKSSPSSIQGNNSN